MKKPVTYLTALAALSGFLPSTLHAQGTIYYSNLGATPTVSAAIGSDFWVAQPFFTGTNAAGYFLNSVELLMASASGNPAEFALHIYSSNPSTFELPGNNLAILNGLDPLSGGIYGYNSLSSLILSPSTAYFIVATANTPLTVGAFNWSATRSDDSVTGIEGWGRYTYYYSSAGGQIWHFSREYNFQFAINATAVPEPSALALAGIGGLLLAGTRLCRRKTAG